MSKVEEMLSDKKLGIDELIVPEELENRLNNALQNKSFNKKEQKNGELRLLFYLLHFFW